MNVKEGFSGLSITAVSGAIGWFNLDEDTILYLVVPPVAAAFASEIIKELCTPESNLALMVRYVSFLNYDTWFLTDGEKVVWNCLN